MHIAFLGHSIVSDWNHGNAHFFRGLIKALHQRGHHVTFLEPHNAWSVERLQAETGGDILADFSARFPFVTPHFYDDRTDWHEALGGFDAVLVHEWTDTPLVRTLAHAARELPCPVLYYDTHHRPVTEPEAIRPRDLPRFDGVIAFGASLRDVFVRDFGTAPDRTFVLHEAADAEEFAPQTETPTRRDLVFVGNWSEDRAKEMETYFFAPRGVTRALWGVLYPEKVQARMQEGGVEYGGYLPNTEVPRRFAESRLVAHIHRGPYRRFLPGIPTIRMFEALACGACLVSTPWDDAEGLFRDGDYVHLPPGDPTQVYHDLLADPGARTAYGRRGRETILARHTCGHRADELIGILSRPLKQA